MGKRCTCIQLATAGCDRVDGDKQHNTAVAECCLSLWVCEAFLPDFFGSLVDSWCPPAMFTNDLWLPSSPAQGNFRALLKFVFGFESANLAWFEQKFVRFFSLKSPEISGLSW